MTHHGHLVKSRLAIKHHKIIVLHVSFNLHTITVYNFYVFSATTTLSHDKR